MAEDVGMVDDAARPRAQAIAANNSVWELLDAEAPDVTELLSRACAASYHWARAADRTAANSARASWLLARCHVVCGHGELALHHADECAAVVAEAGLRARRGPTPSRERGAHQGRILFTRSGQGAASACSLAAR